MATPKPTTRPARARGVDVQGPTSAHLERRIEYLRRVVDGAVKAGDHGAATKWFVELRRAEDELLARRRAADLAAITDPLAHAIACRDAALAEGSATAASQWGGRIAEMEAELAAAARQQDAGPLELSAEEWAERVRADASAASQADLDIYAAEWVRRYGYRFATDDDGALRLERAT